MDQSATGSIDKGLHTTTNPLQAYEWSQDEDTVDVTFQLPPAHRAAPKKSLRVDMSSTTLLVTRLAEAAAGESEGRGEVLLQLTLFAAIKVGDSTWSRSGDNIEFALEKQQEAAWAQLEALPL